MSIRHRIKHNRLGSALWLAFAMLPLAAGCQVEVDDGSAGEVASGADEVMGGGCYPGEERACGGLLGLRCERGEFCDYELEAMCGAFDMTGVCKPIPQVCTKIYAPVCGCDGNTYANECMANAAGVSVAARGECSSPPQGRACGGLLGLACDKGEFCNYAPDAMCGAADQTGICTPIPQVCTREYDPVCGCDGNTYPNECTANAAGVSVASRGECSSPPQGRACGGLLGLACDKGEFCNYAPDAMCGAADQTGICTPIPQVCTDHYDPVCGCDGRTYSNACMANAAGVSVASRGECGPAPGKICGTRGAEPCGPGLFCNFPPEAECGSFDAPGTCAPIPDVCTDHYDPVCGCDGRTYSNACMANAAGVSVASRGECKQVPPRVKRCGGIAGFACDAGYFCNYSLDAMCGAADQMGICTPIPEACTFEYQPVCGCDDKTYGNACMANAAGVSVASRGECPDRR